MKIEFYEEFPSKENLKKLKLIPFPTKVFIAAHSLEEFKKFKKIAKSYKKDLEIAYWPKVKNSYWVSPFSKTKDLKELFQELNSIKDPILIDLELPLRKNWKLYLKGIWTFRKNKKLIKEFLEENKKRVTTAEYPFTLISFFMRLMGFNYKINYERSIMWYSSMMKNGLNKKIKSALSKTKRKENYSISLGTIAVGVFGNEPILSQKNLEKDLAFIKKCGFKKVVIFRLGGINKEYIKVLSKFI